MTKKKKQSKVITMEHIRTTGVVLSLLLQFIIALHLLGLL